MRVRRYRASDEAAALALHVHALEHAGGYIPGPWNDDLRAIEEVYDEFLVGYAGEQLVAMGGLRRLSATSGELKRMRVHPDHQRQGLGQAILDRLEASAVELGLRELILDTTTSQTAAQAFYRKNGYEETGREKHGRFELVLLRKRLGGLDSLCADAASAPTLNLAIFDIDGTLVESVRVDSDCFVRAFEAAFSIRRIDTAWERYDHATDSSITRTILRRHFGREPYDAELARVRTAFLRLLVGAHADNPFREVPGAGSALRRLRAEAGWQVAVGSGSWRATGLFKLQSAGVECDPSLAAFSDDALTREQIVQTVRRRAEEHYGYPATRVAYVGDAVWDVRTCRNLGVPFVGVGRRRHAETLRAAGAATVVPDYSDFETFRRALETAEVPR